MKDQIIMNRTFRYISLITFGAVLATGINYSTKPAYHDRVSPQTQHLPAKNVPKDAAQKAAEPKYSTKELYRVSALNGWRVEVYSQPVGALRGATGNLSSVPHLVPKSSRTADLLGSFEHTGSWVDLAEY